MLSLRSIRVSLYASIVVLAVGELGGLAHADSVLTFKYTPAPRAQIAIWIEDASGAFLATVALTESVAFRGIGNRPGASNMNSGYRWPYGRREGVLPIWALRRASAPGARRFPRVIFQNRIEGLASRLVDDQSPDAYYCLQFDMDKASRDELDAVSCATPFSSDKGRYLTEEDLQAQYAEPFEPRAGEGMRQTLPLDSLYPPRMDVDPCSDSGRCFDHPDVSRFAADARAVMPEIDVVTVATPPGDEPARVLFSVPSTWPHGTYAAFIEVNLEGDYNADWNDTKYPTPHLPSEDWDYYSLNYGYPYRGQPSLVWKVVFELGPDRSHENGTLMPIGRASWDYWRDDYGALEPISFDDSDPDTVSASVPNSGAQRLRTGSDGYAFVVVSDSGDAPVATPAPNESPGVGPRSPPATQPRPQTDAGTDPDTQRPTDPELGGGDVAGSPSPAPPVDAEGSETPDDEPAPTASPVGEIAELSLRHDPDRLRSHTWVRVKLRAARSELPLHAYEVRVATEAITDAATFIRNGRQAKDATDEAEGATLLSLPTDVPAGDWIEASIGDLAAGTHYYVGVRATDQRNRHGALSVAEITTDVREFATVTPCFIASVAYGSPLADDVGVLRRLRDRYLSPQGLGQLVIAGYYRVGARAAAWLAPHPRLRALTRELLTPIVSAARRLE
ncbi:MAG: CFI-box-CTERM domain-containing protein [Polyangiales bacterium]